MPLSEIRDFIQNRDVELIEEKLLNQKQIVSAKIRDLELISKKLDHRLEFLRDATSSEIDPSRGCRGHVKLRLVKSYIKLYKRTKVI